MKRRSTLVAACLVTFALPARADDATDIQALLSEHVVVTASSTAQTASAAPALSTTLTADDIQTFGFRSIAEAINFLSLGVLTTDPLRTPDIGSRGVLFENDNGKHFLLMINGHAINDPLYGAARFDQGAGIPIDLVDHIEIVLGPGSVLYGSNAMMGVINVVTKSAADYTGVHLVADTEFGRSYRVGAGAGFTFKLFGAPSEVTAGVEYYDQRGPAISFPVQQFGLNGTSFANQTFGPGLAPGAWGGTVRNAYFTQAPMAQLRLRSGDFEVNLFANAYRRGIPYDAADGTLVSFDDGSSQELDRAVRVDVRHHAAIGAITQLTSRLYADAFDYQRRLDAGDIEACFFNVACQRYDAGQARWIGLEERAAFNWLQDQTLVTTLGVDARERQVEAKEDLVNVSTGGALLPTRGLLNASAPVISPYAQQTYVPTRWLDFNAGARLDIDTRFSPVLSPRGAVAVRPFEGDTLKLIYSQAFRAPTWSETSVTDYEVAPTPNLQPETVRSVEASVEQRLGTQRILFGAFRTWWFNLIESGLIAPTELAQLQTAGVLPLAVNNIIQYTNVARIDNYGWNGGWDGSSLANRLRYGVNATGAFTRLVQGGVSAIPPVAPQIFGNARISYAAGGYWPTATCAVFAMGPRPADRTTPTGGTLPDAPASADLRAVLTGRVPAIRGLTYVLSADYVTANHGPYTAGPSFGSNVGILLAEGATFPSPGFAPIEQERVMLGLRFDLGTGRASDSGDVP
jgi:outer membrane receptor for ferrienterochelin and colicins